MAPVSRPPPATGRGADTALLRAGADECFGLQWIEVFHLVQVHTRRERPVAGAPEHDSPQILVVATLADPPVQRLKHYITQQIQVRSALDG